MSDRPKRKLIEVALPLEAISVASAREKAVRTGQISNLHYWWSRKPLATCRAVLFASLVDDPSSDPGRFPTVKAVEDERTRLFGIIERLVQWGNGTSEAVFTEARAEILRSTGGKPPPVLDPFCGGGSIPLEAQRLGLTAYASDLNPVAVLITKALIEIPPQFADMSPVHPDARRGIGATGAWRGTAGLAEDVRRYGAWMRDEAERRIGHLYPKVRLPKEHGGGEATVIAWIWARTVTCPNPGCGAEMPLVGKFDLSAKPGKSASVHPEFDRERRIVRYVIHSGPGITGSVSRSGARCVVCSTAVPFSYVRSEGRAGRVGQRMTAIVAAGPKGRLYLPPDEWHEAVAASAEPSWAPDTSLPDEALGFRVQAYGLLKHRQLFTERQLTSLALLTDLVGGARSRAWADAQAALGTNERSRGYADAVATYLALAVSNTTTRNNALVSWMLSVECPSHLFSMGAIPMSWDTAEANILAGPTGSFTNILEGVVRGIKVIPVSSTASRVTQGDARRLASPTPTAVSTDPPYFDNIAYGDLSNFFYIWLRRALSQVYPSLFETVLVPTAAELLADPSRYGSKAVAADEFKHGLEEVFTAIGQLPVGDAPHTCYYAFKQSEASLDGAGSEERASTGWETLLEALAQSGMTVVGTWPVRTERRARARSLASNALASSVVLVCRPREIDAGITTRKDLVASLKREMPEALRTLQHGNIAPVDLAQSSIGPGMAIFSRHAKVLEPDGSPMRVRTALALINQVLDELLTEQEGEFDADTRWAIAWYGQFGLQNAEFGVADVLARAKNTSVGGLVEAGIVSAARGRVRLLARAEYSAGWDPATDTRIPVWEATQRLVHILLTDGEAAAGALLARLGGLGDIARDLAYRMYHVAERKGWTDEARAYNALVVAWTDLARGAESARAAQPAQASLGLE